GGDDGIGVKVVFEDEDGDGGATVAAVGGVGGSENGGTKVVFGWRWWKEVVVWSSSRDGWPKSGLDLAGKMVEAPE
ncbi:hypothetical protein Tco_0160778, partial [Tanacetum coccineum]